jgi:PAS domain S-box-containing protein
MPAALRARLAGLVDHARELSTRPGAPSGESILRHLIDHLAVAALVADTDGRYVLANRAASELTGYSNRELCDSSVWDLTPTAMEHSAEILWRAFLQQREQIGDYMLVTKDGRAVRTVYAALAHALPGLHVSLLKPAAPGRPGD